MMRVERIILRLVRLPLRFAFENRWQRITNWTKLLVEVQSAEHVGYGECMAMETPYYSYETVDTAWLAITQYLAKLLLNREFEHPREVAEVFSGISGHHEARGALECACWELCARARAVPLYELLGGRRRHVSSGATVGVEKNIEAALDAVDRATKAGYERIKVKLKPGWDWQLLSAIRSQFPTITILGDANGAYGVKDIDMLASLDRFAPLILEQPFPKAAWSLSAALQGRISSPVCLDESIDGIEDVEHAAEMKAARIVNLKVGRVGGLTEAIRIHDRCAELGLPVFIGSKTETGIGRWLNVALATLGNVLYPSDVAASERYFAEEIVRDPVVLTGPGTIQVLPGPGIGTEPDPSRMLKYTIQTAVLGEAAGDRATSSVAAGPLPRQEVSA